MNVLGGACLFILWNILVVKWKWGTTVCRRRRCDLWKRSDSSSGKLTGHRGFCPCKRDTLMSQVDGIWASWRVCNGLFNWAVCGGQARDINEMSKQRDGMGKKIDKKRQASPLWSLQAHLTMSCSSEHLLFPISPWWRQAWKYL